MKLHSAARLAFPLASAIAALISAPAVHAADLYWNTNGAGALLTDANWAPSSSGPFTTAWANGSDIFFTANSAITYVTTTDVGNLTITGGSTVTLTAAGTYTTGGAVRTFDIGTGSTLVWNSQNISTAAGTGFIKNGGGTWNVGAPSTSFTGGLTINAGTITAGGVNALGSGGALNINGGTIQGNSGTARDFSGKFTGIIIGGDFALGDATNNGALTFNAATNLGAADRTITLRSAATFNGVIGGDSGVGLTKAGTGTLTFSGTAVNTFNGGLDLKGGTLALSFANFTSGWTDIINSANALNFNGGLMTIAGENSANNTTQTFNGVTVNAGGGSLLVNPNGAGVSNGTTVNLNSLGTLSSWATGSSLVLGKALSAGTGSVTLTTTTDKDGTGIYGGRVVFANGTASTGYDWASTSTGSSPYTLEAYTGYNTTPPTNTGDSATNYSITAGITLDGALAANTLKIVGSATALDLGANTLTLKSGGLLSTGSTSQTISGTAGGTRLTAGSGNGGTEDLVIHQYNTSTLSGANGGLVITAVIGDNTAGSGNAVNLVKTGINTLSLQGANTYTGDTYVNAGTLVIGDPNNSNTTPGSLGASGTVNNYQGKIIIATGATFAYRSNAAQTISGEISGGGSVQKGGPSTLVLSGNNTYTGTTSIAANAASSSSTLSVSSLNSVGSGPGYAPRASSNLGAPTTVANGTIQLGSASVQSTATLIYTGPGETTDRVISLGFGNRDVFLNASGTGLLKFVSAFKVSGGTNGITTLTGTGAGEIVESLPQLATVTNAGLKKTGTGIWTLSGTNNVYTGPTSVTGGTLNVTGNLISNVTVDTSAILSGTGTTTGTLTLNNGSTIVGTTAGSSFKAETVTATGVAGVKIAGSSGSGSIGSHTIGVVRYNTGAGPDTANFSTAGYHSASVSNVGGAGGETQLTYTNEARTWNSASGTWDVMTTTPWQGGDLKFGHGDAVVFDDTGTGGGSARAVTLSSMVTPGSVSFNNSTSTPYTVSGTGNISGPSGLTKTGDGTVTLSTNNTYTGATTVNTGTLLINNTSGSGTGTGAVSVTAGTLGGTGIISGAVTIGDSAGTADSILAPGNSIGAISIGNLAFNSDGSYSCELNGTSGTADQTNVTGTVAINATATLAVSLTGAFTVGQKYYVVVNDGSDAVSGTFAGLAQGAVVGSPGGTDLKISYTGDFATSALTGGNDIVLYTEAATSTPYDDWAVLKGLTGLPGSSTDPAKTADPDNDGKNNLAEFAFDGNPLSGVNDGKIVGKIATVGGDEVLTLSLPVRTGATFSPNAGDQLSALIDGIYYRIEGDVDLSTFADTITEVGAGAELTAIQADLPGLSSGDWIYRTFRAPGTVPTEPKAFLRAKVSETP